MSGVPLTSSPSYTQTIMDTIAHKQARTQTAKQAPPTPPPDLERTSRLHKGCLTIEPGLCCVAKLPPNMPLEMGPTFCIYMDQSIIHSPAFKKRRWPPVTQTRASKSGMAACDVKQSVFIAGTLRPRVK